MSQKGTGTRNGSEFGNPEKRESKTDWSLGIKGNGSQSRSEFRNRKDEESKRDLNLGTGLENGD